jgi:hypothetical protein
LKGDVDDAHNTNPTRAGSPDRPPTQRTHPMHANRTDATRTEGSAAMAPEVMTEDPVAEPQEPGDGSWLLRRLRVVARRRVRVAVEAIDATARIASDGDLAVALEIVHARDPRILAWRANREVDLVVVHDGCGARVVGAGGTAGRIELPGALGPDAFLAFCYDTDPGPSSL